MAKTIIFKKSEFPKIISKIWDYINALADDREYSIKITECHNKRSLTANGYYWSLLDQLAAVCRTSDDEMHLLMLQRYGTVLTDEHGQAVIISTQAEIEGLPSGIYYKYIGDGWVGGKQFRHYKLIKGSRYYDTKEMARLIDGLVSECKEVGIETLTPEELARLRYE